MILSANEKELLFTLLTIEQSKLAAKESKENSEKIAMIDSIKHKFSMIGV